MIKRRRAIVLIVSKLWTPLTASASAASVYSGYEVDDDWCVSVLQSYQAEGDTLFPWSVGESATPAPHVAVVWLCFAWSHALPPSFQERT